MEGGGLAPTALSFTKKYLRFPKNNAKTQRTIPIPTKIQTRTLSATPSAFGVGAIIDALAFGARVHDVTVKLLSSCGVTGMHFDDAPKAALQNESSVELSQPLPEHLEHASHDPQLLSPGQNCACVLKFLESLSMKEPVRRNDDATHLMAAGSSAAVSTPSV